MKKYILFVVVFIFLFYSPGRVQAQVQSGNYITINGGYIKASLPSSASLAAFSFETWIKPQSISGQRNILTVGNSNEDQVTYQIGINGGSLSLFYTFNDGRSLRSITVGNLEVNKWQHVSVVISSVATSLYINGNLVSSTPGTTSLDKFGPDVIIGTGISTQMPINWIFPNHNYYGDLDELRISASSRNINSDWNNNIYQSSLAADSATLLLWHFDQNRGETNVVDSSSNNISGILIGGDSKIHYNGVLPTPTRFLLPTLAPVRRITLPELPITSPQPTSSIPAPTAPSSFDFSRSNRPVFSR